MKFSKLSTIAGSIALGAGLQIVAVPALADAVELPAANCGLTPTSTCLTFQDFDVYSLPLLHTYQGDPTSPLYSSLTGLNLVGKPNEGLVRVLWTSAQGTSAQGTGTQIDDPYDARTGGSGSTNDNLLSLFASAKYGGTYHVPSDPVGGPTTGDNILQSSTTINGGTTGTTTYKVQNSDSAISNSANYENNCFNNLNGCMPLWDTTITDLKAALAGGDPVFFFRNNETGDKSSLAGQDLLAWMRVCLSDLQGVAATVCFTLSGNTVDGLPGDQIGFGQSQTAGVDDILPTSGDKWAYVHSELCISDGTNGVVQGLPDFNGRVIPGNCQKQGLNGNTLDNNLGQNTATYAMVSNALNTALGDNRYDILTIDGRLSHLNDGGDLLWIGSTAATICPPTDPACVSVPEPDSLALTALGFGLLGFLGLRRQRQTVA